MTRAFWSPFHKKHHFTTPKSFFMNSLKSYFDKCILYAVSKNFPAKFVFIATGLLATIWFLVRVIPKPQRATYPCMRAAAPWASGFVIYLLGLSASVVSFRRFRQSMVSGKYLIGILFLVLCLSIALFTLPMQSVTVFSAPADAPSLEGANKPMGIARGILPGRVVWVMDARATNPDCTNEFNDGYFMDKNTDQDIVDRMLDQAILQISGKADLAEAWQEIFLFHNQERNKGSIGYLQGEKIFIKINRTSSWSGNFDTSDLSRVNNNNYAISETSPQVVTAVLRHLVNIAGVPEENIFVGDPMKHIYKDDYEKWHSEFPKVTYLDRSYNTLGRESVVKSATAKIKYSDEGAVLRTGTWQSAIVCDPVYDDYLYTIFEEMEYMLNIPTMKGHKHAGVTMFAKNHFGSHTQSDAKHLHGGLTRTSSADLDPMRNKYGMYRVLTDIMAHKLLGDKNLLYIMDALYSSEMEVARPVKFQKDPWNNHWSSSIFVSQDPVAIESVGFDVLYYEMDGSNGLDAFPHFGAVDDYLHHAADKSTWPQGIQYDPNDDGKLFQSLGVHEHWNNSTDRKYTRNLGTGNGIELVFIDRASLIVATNDIVNPQPEIKTYPNPARYYCTLSYSSNYTGIIEISIVDINGSVVQRYSRLKSGNHFTESLNISDLTGGTYFLRVMENSHMATTRMQIVK
jgi:hypothetical protein